MEHLLTGAVLALVAQPAGAEVVASSDAGFVTRQTAVVKADPAAVWQALIAPGGWWNSEHTYSGDAKNMYLDAQATGCFCEKLPVTPDSPVSSRGGSIEHMHVIYAAPARALRMKGGLGPLQSEAVDATLTVTLKDTPEGTRILWEYVVGGYMRMKTSEIAPLVDKVLSEQIEGLAKTFGSAGAGEPKRKKSKE